MNEIAYPKPTLARSQKRHRLAPAADDAFRAFSAAVFADGALDRGPRS